MTGLVSALLCLTVPLSTLGVESGFPARRVGVLHTNAGADLVTFYRGDVPQLSVLRDTLGDPHEGAHRLRQVWSLPYARPNWKQRIAAAMPFFYHRAGRNVGSLNGVPSPIFDLSDPTRGTWSRIGGALLQSAFLDGHGFFVRAPTRSYRGNATDFRNMFLARAAFVTEEDAFADPMPADITNEDWNQVEGRLLLGRRLLGGFVSDERAASAAKTERTESSMNSEANWDLLRQSAEDNGLYLTAIDEPRAEGGTTPREAVLWFAKPQKSVPAPERFASGFLRISNPWEDSRLRNWSGYTETWSLDAEGVPVEAGGKPTAMIPLAIYALDYPRVPVLLIDFRSDRAKFREITRRAADDVAVGVLGMTTYGSLSWFAARTSYQWVRDRHGAAFDRSQRQAAYARLRQHLLDVRDGSESGFSRLVESKLNALALNPFEQSTANERTSALRQQASLERWAANPNGLKRTLNRARAKEFYGQTHGTGARIWTKTLAVASFGLLHPYGAMTSEKLEALNRQRRLDSATRFLREAESAPPAQLLSEADLLRKQAEQVKALAAPLSEETTLADRILAKLDLHSPATLLPLKTADVHGAGQ